MKRRYLAALPLLSTLILGTASLAEAPAESVIDQIRTTNVQRLLLTNRCKACDFVGMDLSKTHLIGADLRGAILTGANLSWSNLEGADLTGADLTGANLTGAFLTNASLVDTTLDNANFTQAQLIYVDVTGASMENLNLADANVIGTPISIGGEAPPIDNNQPLPILSPDDSWQLPPPPLEPWFIPEYPSEEILDIPPQIIPEV